MTAPVLEKYEVFKEQSLNQKFQKDGFVVIPLLNNKQIEYFRCKYEEFSNEDSDGFYSTAYSTDRQYRQRLYDELSPIYQGLIDDILVNQKCRIANYVLKEANSNNSRLFPHQDYTFCDPSEHAMVHIWMPLVDVDESNGCLRVAPGSHEFFKHISAIKDNPSPYNPYLEYIEHECMISLPMPAGHAVLYEGRLLHSSNPNLTESMRLATTCVTLAKDANCRVYAWEASEPTNFRVLEMTDEEFRHFDPFTVPKPPYGPGTHLVKELTYQMRTPEMHEIVAWRDSIKAESENIDYNKIICKELTKPSQTHPQSKRLLHFLSKFVQFK